MSLAAVNRLAVDLVTMSMGIVLNGCAAWRTFLGMARIASGKIGVL
jgi:hypothetical protein